MPGRVTLTIVEGPMKDEHVSFEEHDTLIFGRQEDCHIRLKSDPGVSRHHFILEANPPDVRLRDLGSLNGTHVNGTKIGGRARGESPEDGARRRHTYVDLAHDDRIQVGASTLVVQIEGASDQTPEPIQCAKCGKDVAQEVGQARRGDYVCEACRQKAAQDPIALLVDLLRRPEAVKKAKVGPDISGYEITRSVGAGGFGAVYLARRLADDQPVAIKVMLAQVAVDEDSRAKFLREIDSMKSLRHTNIVTLLDNGSAGSAFYFVMEYCPGGSAFDLMSRRGGTLSLDEAGPIMLDSLRGLADAHRQGYIHRDLKPQNILLNGSDGHWEAKLCDFGLAKNFQQAGLSGMTMAGSVAGTPPFMPREQITNYRFLKPTGDVWSIGATFYCLLTGRFPRDFPRGADPVEVILDTDVVPIQRRDSTVPLRLAAVIDRSLEEDPQTRFPDAGKMYEALSAAL